jgi:hypothetical protein
MRGYGRDYEHRNWLDRAGETVRGWFGGDRDYDRDYGAGGREGWNGWDGGNVRSMHREWDRGMDRGRMMGGQGGDWDRETDWRGVGGGGYRMNNWNNQHASREAVERHLGGYYGADYEDRGGWPGGGTRHSRMGSDYGRDYGRWGQSNRGMSGRGGTGRGSWGGNTRDAWLGNEYGGGGYNAGNDWGDYNRNGMGGDRFRNSRSGGVEPGRYYDGYGIGSSGGQGYEPF